MIRVAYGASSPTPAVLVGGVSVTATTPDVDAYTCNDWCGVYVMHTYCACNRTAITRLCVLYYDFHMYPTCPPHVPTYPHTITQQQSYPTYHTWYSSHDSPLHDTVCQHDIGILHRLYCLPRVLYRPCQMKYTCCSLCVECYHMWVTYVAWYVLYTLALLLYLTGGGGDAINRLHGTEGCVGFQANTLGILRQSTLITTCGCWQRCCTRCVPRKPVPPGCDD